MIERNLVDVLALLASIEARHVYFFTLEEERSTQDRASADQQRMHREGTNPTMEVGYLLKCILVVLVFFGLPFLVKIIVGVRATAISSTSSFL